MSHLSRHVLVHQRKQHGRKVAKRAKVARRKVGLADLKTKHNYDMALLRAILAVNQI
jgi:hypothetical protein